MEQTTFKETYPNLPTTPLKEVSLNDKLVPKIQDEGETEARESEKGKHLMRAKRWRFQYLTIDIGQCVSSHQVTKENTSLKELCKYILKNSQKKELVICLFKPKPPIWFKQFYFIKQESLKHMAEAKPLSAKSAVGEMGPGYRILYDHNAVDNTLKNELESCSQESIYLSDKSQRDDDFDEDEEESESENENEAILGIQKHNPKSTEKPQETESFPPRSFPSLVKNSESRRSRRALISHWYGRIFRGETISQIREDLGKEDNPDLIWAFMQSLDLLIKVQENEYLFPKDQKQIFPKVEEEGHGQILRKRLYEEDEEYEGEKPKKFLRNEDENGRKKAKNLSEKDNKKKVLKKKKEKEVKLNPTEHDLLADSIPYYKGPENFKEAIRSLPLFQKELAAFEDTLSPEEVRVIEDAMDKGFNPIHYIYQYKIGVKSLANIRGGIYKKCVNTPSLKLIYRYVSHYLQKRNLEEESNEDNKENIEQ